MASPRGLIEEEKCVVSLIIMEMGLGDKSLVNERLSGKGRTGEGINMVNLWPKEGWREWFLDLLARTING